MRVHKFLGPNSRAAMREVRTALGGDAVILSTRNVANGVEILAVAERDMVAIVAPPPGPQGPTVRPWRPEAAEAPQSARAAAMREQATIPQAERAEAALALSPHADALPQALVPVVPDPVAREIQSIKQLLERQLAGLVEHTQKPAGVELANEIRSMRGLLEQQFAVLAQAATAQKTLAAQARINEAAVAATQAKLGDQAVLVDEVKSMRALLQQELAQMSWSETARRSPARIDLHRRLLAAGYGAATARAIPGDLPGHLSVESAQGWLRDTLEHRLVVPAEDEVVRGGGVFALVGPTGVGKTTTTAKIAARFAVRFGSRRLALVTTDSYRVGAHDQLRAYGNILGVPVQVAQDPATLAALVASLHERHLVLIDTMGTGQRDTRLVEMLAALDQAGARRLLLLNAASQAETLEDVIGAWRSDRLAGCVLTKIDEAVKLGPALDCLARHGHTLHYVANGQRVPEDLHVPNPRYLVHRSLRAVTVASLALAEHEYPLVASVCESADASR